MFKRILLLFFVLVFPFVYCAEGEDTIAFDKEVEVVESVDSASDYQAFEFGSAFMSMLMSLSLIIGLVLLVGWLFKRFMNVRIAQINTSSIIKIRAKRSLAPKSSIYLVEIYGKGFIVGETQSGLQHLGNVDIEEIEEEEEEIPKVSSKFSFGKVFKQKLEEK
jgi:flagellar biogenesis protein FliO